VTPERDLNLELDVIVSLIGGWQTDFFASLEPARNLSVAMIIAHLRTGHDVVTPQLVTSLGEAERFAEAARSAKAEYVEMALLAPVEEQVRRFRTRNTRNPVHRQIAKTVDSMGGDSLLRTIDDDARYLEHRPEALRVETSGVDVAGVHARLLAHLTPRPS
jgi:hypothetical protein